MKGRLIATAFVATLAAGAAGCAPPPKEKPPLTERIMSREMGTRAARLLHKEIQKLEVGNGMGVPLTDSEREDLAKVLAAHYSKRKRGHGRALGIPDNYAEDLQIMGGLMGRGFGMEEAENVLSMIKRSYNSDSVGKTMHYVIPRLHPGMSEEEIRLEVEAPLFADKWMARKSWKSTPHGRIAPLLGKDAGTVTKALKEQLTQEEYETAVDIIKKFENIWRNEIGTTSSPLAPGRKTRAHRMKGRNEYQRGYIRKPLVWLMTSDTFAGLNNEEKAQVLFKLVSSLRPFTNWGKIKPREEAMGHLEKAFSGKEPTAEEVLGKLDKYIQKHPRHRPESS